MNHWTTAALLAEERRATLEHAAATARLTRQRRWARIADRVRRPILAPVTALATVRSAAVDPDRERAA